MSSSRSPAWPASSRVWSCCVNANIAAAVVRVAAGGAALHVYRQANGSHPGWRPSPALSSRTGCHPRYRGDPIALRRCLSPSPHSVPGESALGCLTEQPGTGTSVSLRRIVDAILNAETPRPARRISPSSSASHCSPWRHPRRCVGRIGVGPVLGLTLPETVRRPSQTTPPTPDVCHRGLNVVRRVWINVAGLSPCCSTCSSSTQVSGLHSGFVSDRQRGGVRIARTLVIKRTGGRQ